MTRTHHHISLSDRHGTHNYHPLPVVLEKGQGAWVWDVEGRKYLDMLSAYSAVNQGHSHPRMLETLVQQANRITLTSRAFHNDQLGPWLEELTAMCLLPKAIPMNSGAEAVETAVKLARKWAYKVKKIPANTAEIIVCSENFHGRTISIVSFSTDAQYREDFGPFTPGFKVVPYGDAKALEDAITPHTAAFLVEPLQGEAGVVVPPAGYLKKVREICTQNNVLFIADEIQTGLGRTGRMFCVDHDGVKPDLLILGKALGGGFYPISAVVGIDAVMSLLRPGDHGSTFGGNPLACALSRTALSILKEEKLAERSERLGQHFRDVLKATLPADIVKDVRGKGLLNAVEIHASAGRGRSYTEALLAEGILAKETHNTTVRFAPPLVIDDEALNWSLEVIRKVFSVRRG